MTDDIRLQRIGAIQVAAVNLQQACRWMPGEDFFPTMIGIIGTINGPDEAAWILTTFEIARQEHEAMIDGMVRDPKESAQAMTAVWNNKKSRKKQ